MAYSTVKRGDWARTLLISLVLVTAATGQNLEDFQNRLTEFALDNGLKFLVFERHRAPVVACHTHVNVGAADEVKGITGLAHLLEHLAFRGTRTIGTRDYEAETELMDQMDELFQVIKLERERGCRGDEQRLGQLLQEFDRIQQEGQGLLIHDEFEGAFKRAGGIGLNARTNYDSTIYRVSLPSNRLELWMFLESERLLRPVLREFYREKDVVMEERRQRVESNPVGRLSEEFLALAYKAHPYGEPAVGHMSDLQAITRAEARAFLNTHYVPGNLTVAIVGDVDPDRVKQLTQVYFGRIPYGPKPSRVETKEPPQLGERRVVIQDTVKPIVLIGYHKPSIDHPDSAVFDAIDDVLGTGRTSRLYTTLVKDKKIAIHATSFQGRPGTKYPGLFIFYAVPGNDHTNGECERAIYDEVERLKSELISEAELEKAKTRARAKLVRRLSSNSGLAEKLAFYEAVTGRWQNLFKELDRIQRVTVGDIQRVAIECFKVRNRTVAMIETMAEEE